MDGSDFDSRNIAQNNITFIKTKKKKKKKFFRRSPKNLVFQGLPEFGEA